jgi:hypothetical protein
LARPLANAGVIPARYYGEWLPWLKDNFGWSVQTASSYMRVAEAFKLKPGFILDADINIDAKALYLRRFVRRRNGLR